TPVIMLSSVDLPAPDLPTMPRNSHASTCRSIPFSAVKSPAAVEYVLTTSRNSMRCWVVDCDFMALFVEENSPKEPSVHCTPNLLLETNFLILRSGKTDLHKQTIARESGNILR